MSNEAEGDRNIAALTRIHAAFKEAGSADVIAALTRTATAEDALAQLPAGVVEAMALIDERVEVDQRHGGAPFGHGGVWRGLEEWLEFWREWLEPWEEFDYETSNFEAIGPHVLMDIAIRGRGRESGVPVEWSQTQIWTFEDGRVVRMRPGYETRELALEAIRAPDPIDVVRGLNDWWARRDFETTRELLLASSGWDDAAERFRDAGLEVDPIAPDVEVVIDAFPEGGKWIGQRGRDEWIRFWQEWVRPWKDFEFEHAHYEQIGDHVIVEVRVRARDRERGETVEIPAVQLFRVRDGLIDLYAVYQSRDHAFAAITAE